MNDTNVDSFTCPATASPSARSEDVNQTCKQIWNAAIGVAPNLVANDAANVTQPVAANTLNNNRNPEKKVSENVALVLIDKCLKRF